jgi:hypothetical protein
MKRRMNKEVEKQIYITYHHINFIWVEYPSPLVPHRKIIWKRAIARRPLSRNCRQCMVR